MKNVLVVGSGMMGTQIAFQCATNNCNVSIFDIKEESLEYSRKTMKHYLKGFESNGILSSEASRTIFDSIRFTTDAEAAGKNADFVSESVPENPKLKGAIFKQFHEICPPNAIFITNTSSLIPSMFAEATGRPDKVAALHFHPNVWENKIVDVMPHPGTSKETIDTVKQFAISIDQIPIMLEKENHSYVFNNMLGALLDSAITLAANEVATIQNIDRSWMGVMHSNIGPFGIMDFIGLETMQTINKYWYDKTGDAGRKAKLDFIEQYTNNGLMGIKTQRGFYSYPNPEYADENFVSGSK